MEKNKWIRQSLEHNAAKIFPGDSSVVLPVLEKITGIRREGNSRWVVSPGISLLLALAAMAVIATAAFAVYHFLLDPGLQAVKDAGLGQEVNSTAIPTLNPQLPTDSFQPLPATLVGAEQTEGDVTVSLDWISVNSTRVLFGFSATGLSSEMSFALPAVTFPGIQPEQYRGASFEVKGSTTLNAEFISYQVINDPSISSGINLAIDLPLVTEVNGSTSSLNTFHFDLQDIPFNTGQPASGQQTFSAKVNGVEVILDWVKITPADFSARFCLPASASGLDWKIQGLSLQKGNGDQPRDISTARASFSDPVPQDERSCLVARIPMDEIGAAGDLKFSIAELTHAGESLKGPWEFYVRFPESDPTAKFPLTSAVSQPATEPPLAVQSAGDMRATLKWAYADASQVAMEIHFDGWQEGYFLGGLSIKDDLGNDINTGYGSVAAADDPSTHVLTLYPDLGLLSSSPISLHLDLPVFTGFGESNPTVVASFHFDLQLPVYQARSYGFDQTVTANGSSMRLLKVEITPSSSVLTVCFDKPTHGDWSDWMIGFSSTLQVGENSAQGNGGGVIFDTDLGGYVTKGAFPRDLPADVRGRCVKMNFPVGDLAKTGPLQFTLTVPELQISMPESIPDDQVNSAIAKLRTEGIDMSFYTSSESGGGGGGYTFNSLPAGMTDEQAYHRFMQVLGFVYPGPWEFQVTLP